MRHYLPHRCVKAQSRKRDLLARASAFGAGFFIGGFTYASRRRFRFTTSIFATDFGEGFFHRRFEVLHGRADGLWVYSEGCVHRQDEERAEKVGGDRACEKEEAQI